MQRLARELLREADIIILHPALKKSWDDQRQLMLGEESPFAAVRR